MFSLALSYARAQQIPAIKASELMDLATHSEKNVVVINFWAIFCKPCLAELPGFVAAREHFRDSSVAFFFVSLDFKEDYPHKVLEIAESKHIAKESFWLNETNADLFCPVIDRSWSGAIPATLIINKKTGYRFFVEEELAAEQIESHISESLK